MTVEQLIERLVALGPHFSRFTVDVRVDPDRQLFGDLRVEDLVALAKNPAAGEGWVTMLLEGS